MAFISRNCAEFPCRLKKVQGKKKRDAEKAEAARVEAEAAGETKDEVEAAPTTAQAGLLNDKDEDVIF